MPSTLRNKLGMTVAVLAVSTFVAAKSSSNGDNEKLALEMATLFRSARAVLNELGGAISVVIYG